MKPASEKSKTYNMEEIEAINQAMIAKSTQKPEPAPMKAETEEKLSWEAKTDKEKTVYEWLGWLKAVCIGVIVGVLLVVFVVQRNDVYGPSMEPTLKNGDKIFAQKISTYMDTFDRGDIVILDGSNMEGYNHEEYLIKRIVGLPGETVRITDGVVYIKEKNSDAFVKLDEPYLLPGTITTVSGIGTSKGYDEITLSSDEYYCLGDNRVVSNDSRNLGPFKGDRIKGVGIFRIYPFGSFGTIK